MKLALKKLTPRFVIALLTFTTGVAVTLLWFAARLRPANTPSVLQAPNTTKSEEVSVPQGWKRLEVNGKVVLQVPPDMEPSELLGDSPSHREAYADRDINITIVYGEPFSCDSPHNILERPTYHEAVIDIDGRKAKLSIDRYHQPKFIIAFVCFLDTDDSAMQLRVLVFCKGERALETAQTIFQSIRFKDTR